MDSQQEQQEQEKPAENHEQQERENGQVSESPRENAQPENGNSEGGEKDGGDKPPERPKHWGNRGGMVPEERLSEVARRAREAEARVAILEAEQRRAAELAKPAADPDDPETLDPKAFTDSSGNFDGAAFLRERDRRVEARAIRKATEAFDQRVQQRDQQNQQRQAVDSINASFRAEVAAESKVDPLVAEAVGYLDSIAQSIPFPVQIALLKAGPKVAKEVAMNPDIITQITRGDAIESAILIGELKGKHKKTSASGASTEDGSVPPFRPGAQGAPVPRTLSGAGGSSSRAASKLSTAEYMRMREAGEI